MKAADILFRNPTRIKRIDFMKRTNVRRLTIIGVLTAISFILLQTGLGIIQIPGLPLKITIMHLPVIIAAIMEGPIAGGITGLFFGVFSILDKLMRPGPIQQSTRCFIIRWSLWYHVS